MKEWEKRAVLEFKKYWLNVLYLGCMFSVLTWYRRLLLMQYHIYYLHYGAAVVEALILAKVILIGDVMHLGRRQFEQKPLIYPTLYKAVVFTLFVLAFDFLENTVIGRIRGKGWWGGVEEFNSIGPYGYMAHALMVFFTFIPFFAFKELSLVLGEGKVAKLFFRKRPRDVEFPGGATQPAT